MGKPRSRRDPVDKEHRRHEKASTSTSSITPHHRRQNIATTTTTTTAIRNRISTVLQLKHKQIWPRISSSIYDYLRNIGNIDPEEEGQQNAKEVNVVDASSVHAVLISSMLGVGANVTSSIKILEGLDKKEVSSGSNPDPDPDLLPLLPGDENKLKEIQDEIQKEIEIELELEFDILSGMLEMLTYKKVTKKKKKKDSDKFVLKTDQRVALLNLVVWALEQWKTLASGGSSPAKHKLVKDFESSFIKVLHQIRIESAISTQLKASNRSLQLLHDMKSIQQRWIQVGGSIRLRLAVANKEKGKFSLVDKLERIVVEEVEDKMMRPLLKLEILDFYKEYEKRLEQLENVCRKTSWDKATQGKLIKEMVEQFKSSVSLDRGHRDHPFFTKMTGHLTHARITFKRAVLWVLLGILPHLQEKGSTIRLLHAMQGVIRQAIVEVTGTDGKREVSTWRLILETYLTDDDLEFLYHRVVNKKMLDAVGSFDVAKNFEYFYPPSPTVDGLEKPQSFTSLLATVATPPVSKFEMNTNGDDEEKEEEDSVPEADWVSSDCKVLMKKPKLDDENEDPVTIPQPPPNDDMKPIDSILKLSCSSLHLEEAEDDPWEIKETNWDDLSQGNVDWTEPVYYNT